MTKAQFIIHTVTDRPPKTGDSGIRIKEAREEFEMKTYLSYILNPEHLVWPGEPTIKVRQCTKIEGDSPCNTFLSELPNHCGTHYDAPWHFNPNGPKITELPMEYFWFTNVLVLDIPKKRVIGQKALVANSRSLDNLRSYEAHSIPRHHPS